MLASDMNYLTISGWQAVLPGLAIVITVGSLGIIADGIRDATRNGVQTLVALDGAGATDTTETTIERVA